MIYKSLYTKKLGNRVALLAKPAKPDSYHIIFGDNGEWMVVTEGKTRAHKKFHNREKAIIFARQNAVRNSINNVVIHKNTGEVEDIISLA